MAQQFQVPQFIEYEARLIGPLTVKQTGLLGIGAGVLFVLWFIAEKWLFFLLAFPIALFMLLLGFMKINGRPLLDFVGSFFSFFISPQLYIWQKRKEAMEKVSKKKQEEVRKFTGPTLEMTKEGIRELAKRLDGF